MQKKDETAAAEILITSLYTIQCFWTINPVEVSFHEIGHFPYCIVISISLFKITYLCEGLLDPYFP